MRPMPMDSSVQPGPRATKATVSVVRGTFSMEEILFFRQIILAILIGSPLVVKR